MQSSQSQRLHVKDPIILIGIECGDQRIARDKVIDHMSHLHGAFVDESSVSSATDDVSSRTNRQGKP
jgi:hypothetical protein